MKLIIAGSRSLDITNEELQELIFNHFEFPDEIVCGEAKGIDLCGRIWAETYSPDWSDDIIAIPVISFPANWDKYGRAAGYVRNEEMAKYADQLLAIWDGKSNGTRHMIKLMIDYKKPFHVELLT